VEKKDPKIHEYTGLTTKSYSHAMATIFEYADGTRSFIVHTDPNDPHKAVKLAPSMITSEELLELKEKYPGFYAELVQYMAEKYL
jgi:hypothetical protein